MEAQKRFLYFFSARIAALIERIKYIMHIYQLGYYVYSSAKHLMSLVCYLLLG